ncbi:MAG: hypothetical protein ACYTFG_00335 [Planctomycetota bacterium]
MVLQINQDLRTVEGQIHRYTLFPFLDPEIETRPHPRMLSPVSEECEAPRYLPENEWMQTREGRLLTTCLSEPEDEPK